MNSQLFVFRRLATLTSTGLAILAGLYAIAFEPGQPTPKTDDTSVLMRAKLASSERVLEGLVTENFTLIKRGAAEMHQIGLANRWPQSTDQVYGHYSQNFRNLCQKLAEQAESRNLEAAHYTYLHLTTSCIDCHNYVRGKFRIQRNKDKQGPIQLIPTEWDNPPSSNHDQVPTRPSKYPRGQGK